MAAKVWLSMRWGRETALTTKGTGNFGMRKIFYLDYDGDYIIDFFFSKPVELKVHFILQKF